MDDLTRNQFVTSMLPIANDEKQRSGINPLITITQSAHESGWGQSELTVKANNLFGFTGDSWESEGKPIIRMATAEFIDGKWITMMRPFRAYKSWAESVRDWATLMQMTRYKLAFEDATAGNIVQFAHDVSMAGYATDPHYASSLIGVSVVVKALLPPETVA